ncbi:MAG: sulfoxide reductase heme-binding subunit YedZ, partial [Xanthobacteraceae bacterium]
MPFLHERSGRWSPVKIAAFAAALLPALWIAYQAATDDLGARPVTEAIHQAGDWTLRFLLMTLAITPAQRILHYPRIILARRTLGVATAGYALLHLSLYVLDQHFDLFKVASEIVLRVYL